ncbi:hypothetical protein [Methylophaga sp.]|uniref:hypothetical protein n=1 Tax=Methylophaga sp. TaxID=2024840 RepID=UPI003A923A06
MTKQMITDLANEIVIESSVEYLDAEKISTSTDRTSQDTVLKGVMVNEGILPGTKLSVRASKAFIWFPPSDRDYAEARDFKLDPDTKWEFFYEHGEGETTVQNLDEADLIDILSSHTEMAIFNPMLGVD